MSRRIWAPEELARGRVAVTEDPVGRRRRPLYEVRPVIVATSWPRLRVRTARPSRPARRRPPLLTSIAEAANASQPEALARQLLILLEGATVVADHLADPHAAQAALSAAQTLLETAADPRR
ncbi:hypothetical protein ACIRL2_47565 [Embleya sp. NPDC127516]|uniref:hypothetical protein n=1 Tax=Embleya sp. NPDC127516 TaxID=3363990 RepID=UPI0037F3C6C0